MTRYSKLYSNVISFCRFGGLAQYVRDLKDQSIRFVTILDPCISTGEPISSYRPFDLGNQMDVWVKKSDGSYALGRVWPNDPTYFADFSSQQAKVSYYNVSDMSNLIHERSFSSIFLHIFQKLTKK